MKIVVLLVVSIFLIHLGGALAGMGNKYGWAVSAAGGILCGITTAEARIEGRKEVS